MNISFSSPSVTINLSDRGPDGNFDFISYQSQLSDKPISMTDYYREFYLNLLEVILNNCPASPRKESTPAPGPDHLPEKKYRLNNPSISVAKN